MRLQGRIKAGYKTKKLVNFLKSGDIAVIRHDDIDELAARSIAHTGAIAVINTGKSMTGRFPALGAAALLKNNVKVFDVNLPLEYFTDDDIVTVVNNDIIIRNYIYRNVCTAVNWEYVEKKLAASKENEGHEILKFIGNTINYAAYEMDKLVYFNGYPELSTKLKGRHVVVVVRNSRSIDEMHALKSYIEKYNPVFIGVDGGADLIVKCGYTPDMLLGDMDSVSDIGIYKSREIILHAYEDGYCPCLERIAAMNVNYKILAVRGTSEDAALMLAYNKGAELIVLVGGHNCMNDFISKGRQGMSSTFIVRALIGSILVDCKGLDIIEASKYEGKGSYWGKM